MVHCQAREWIVLAVFNSFLSINNQKNLGKGTKKSLARAFTGMMAPGWFVQKERELAQQNIWSSMHLG